MQTKEHLTMMDLLPGTRVYTTGDIMNQPKFGTVTAVYENRWGENVTITWDDGEHDDLEPFQFSHEFAGNGDTRFVTEAAYKKYREKYIEESKTQWNNIDWTKV